MRNAGYSRLYPSYALVHQRHDVGSGHRRRAAADQSIARGVDRWPAFDANGGQDRRAVRRTFVCGRGVDRVCEDVGLDLTPECRSRSTAAEADAPDRHAHLGEDRERIAQAERDAFQDRAHDVPAAVARRQTDERGAGIRIAVRRAFAHQIRRPEETIGAWWNGCGLTRELVV